MPFVVTVSTIAECLRTDCSILRNKKNNLRFTRWLLYAYFRFLWIFLFLCSKQLFYCWFPLQVGLSSPDTPATAYCNENLLLAFHNPLLIVLLDPWEQDTLLLIEESVWYLLDLQISRHCVVEKIGKCSHLWNFLPATSTRLPWDSSFLCHTNSWPRNVTGKQPTVFMNEFSEASVVALLL